MTNSLRLSTLPLSLALIVLPVVARAQQGPAGTFGGTVEVRVVNVEAVVTDAKGQRVSGLKPQDFHLLVDGKPVSVDYFSEIREGALAAPVDQAQALSLPPSLTAQGASDAAGTGYLVFVDEYFPLATDRNRALIQLEALVPRLGPADTMAVVAFNGTGLTKLTDWTASRDTLRTVLGQAANRPTGGNLRRFEQADTKEDVELKNYVRRLKEQTEAAVAAATSALRAVQPPAGRKVMILLSGGWAMNPSYLLPASEFQYVQRHNLNDGKGVLRPLVDTANLLGYTLYPCDLSGLQGSLTGEAADRGFDIAQATAFDPTTRGRRPLADSQVDPETVSATAPDETSIQIEAPPVRAAQRELEDQYALQYLARETGGVAMVNSPLDSAFSDTRTFYWLGFSPQAKGDDTRHEIKVELADASLKVRARQSFVDFSLGAQTTMRVESVLLSGGVEGAGALQVTVGTVERADSKTMLVPLEITIPTDEVTALSTTDGYRVELELRAAAIDEWGRPSDIPVVPVVFTSSTPPAPGGHATYRTTVRLRRGTNDVLVTVYDPRLDRLLAKRVKVEM